MPIPMHITLQASRLSKNRSYSKNRPDIKNRPGSYYYHSDAGWFSDKKHAS